MDHVARRGAFIAAHRLGWLQSRIRLNLSRLRIRLTVAADTPTSRRSVGRVGAAGVNVSITAHVAGRCLAWR